MIRTVERADAERLAAIYQPYVTDTTISFETEPAAPAEIAARIQRVTAQHSWLVYEDRGVVAGYAYTSPFRERAAYQATVEATLYLDQAAIGRGLGRALYQALLDESAAKGFRTALGVIALPNERSIRLHEKLGFVKVAHLERVGCKFERWIDVGIWQKHLDALPPITLAAAEMAEAAEILALQRLAYQSEAALYDDYTIPPLTQTLAGLQVDFQEQTILKAVLGERIVGAVRGYAAGGTGYIGRLIVHPAFQNRGLGARLMQAIEAHLGTARYELFTGEHSARNLHVYQKLGYRIFRTERLTGKVTLVYLEKRAA